VDIHGVLMAGDCVQGLRRLSVFNRN
jgi:hypothetical protein